MRPIRIPLFDLNVQLAPLFHALRCSFFVAVAVPTQKISKHAVEDEDQASKNQRFMRDRFTQLNHPNMQTRVDALRALDQLLAEDPQLLLTQISPLIQDTVKLMIDIEPRVRKQLLQLYQRHLSTVASVSFRFPIYLSSILCLPGFNVPFLWCISFVYGIGFNSYHGRYSC